MILSPKFDDSCVLWLDFASVKNNTVYDQSGNNNHGKVYGATHIGRFGLHGLHFDGVDDTVISSFAPLQDKDSYTQIFLAKITAQDQEKLCPLGEFYWNGNSISVTTSGTVWARVHTDYNDGMWYDIQFRENVINKLLFYAFAVDNNTKNAVFFINQNKVGKITFEGDTYHLTDRKIMLMHSLNGRYLQGNIYFVSLYNRALSDAEIRELYYYLTKGIRSIVPSRFVARKVG